MKRAELVFSALLIPLDFLMLIFASIFAYQLRFSDSLSELLPIQFVLPYNEYLTIVLFSIPVFLIIFAIAGLYNLGRTQSIILDINRIFFAISTGMMSLILFVFLRQELFSSRFLVIANWILAIIFVVMGRFFLRRIRMWLFRQGYGVYRIALVGGGGMSDELLQHFKTHPEDGHKVVVQYADFSESDIDGFESALKSDRVDQIINATSHMSTELTTRLIDIAERHDVDYRFVPDFVETKASHVEVDTLGGIPVMSLQNTPLDGWHKIGKRVFDFLVSLCVFLCIWPVLLVVALLVRVDSPGPVVYRNRRVGHKENEFDTYKFRTMKIEYCTGDQYGGDEALEYEAELIKKKSKREGPIYKVLDDPRRTKIGKFLEKTSLDELPQIFNVMKGDMSLVGPRPHQPREVKHFDQHHKRVFEIKPGITGLAQISGRSDLDYEDEFALDVYYMENWSFGTDLHILLKTPFVLLKRRNYT